MHTLISITIALAVLFAGVIVGLCITAKRADEAMDKAIENLRDKGAL